jgi:adenylate cyclase
MAKVQVISIHGTRDIPLVEYNRIGRQPGNEIQILDRIVSKEHAVIFKKDNKFFIRDLNSLNGTYLRNERITEVPLQHLDTIMLGSTKIIYYEEEESADRHLEVKVGDEASESYIHSRFDASVQDRFVSEASIQDIASLRQDYEKLRVAYEIQKSIGSEMDMERLLAKILSEAFNHLRADRGAILLIDEDGVLRPKVLKTNREDTDEIRLSSTIINSVISQKVAVLSSDAMVDSRFQTSKSIMMEGIRSSMAVPIMRYGELLGMMYLDSKVATGAFTERDLQIFSAIAAQTATFLTNIQMAKKLEQEAITREKFSRLLSPNLVDQLVSGKLEVAKGGRKMPVTVLFADIRGFTPLTERTPANEVVDILNEYFERMVEIIFRHEGTLDKFIGDEIMAVWGAPVAQPDHAVQAVLTAWEMQKDLDALNAERAAKGLFSIKVGVGLCSGEVIAGYMGSTKKMEYTVIGDTVNVAARLCSLAGPMDVIIAESTYALTHAFIQTEPLKPIQVKGKSEPMKTFRVLGPEDEVTISFPSRSS